MRLFNFKAMALESFSDHDKVPPYSILSHTWSTEKYDPELIFEDWLAKPDEWGRLVVSMSIEAWKGVYTEGQNMVRWKLLGFFKTSLALGYGYGWVDTLCIDKRVSLCLYRDGHPLDISK